MYIDKPVPHKHASLIKAWADGAQIQYKTAGGSDFEDINPPSWNGIGEYRTKPKPKVKVYQWLCVKANGAYVVSSQHYKSKEEAAVNCNLWTVLDKIEHSMREIDE